MTDDEGTDDRPTPDGAADTTTAPSPSTDGGAPATAGSEEHSPGTDQPASAESDAESAAGAVTVERPTDPATLAGVFLKGLFMGAADTVPGMSGGTVALVTGIYERLIAAITGFDPLDLQHFLRLHRPEGRAGVRETLADVDAPFLLALGTGVLTAVATVAGAVEVVAEQSPGPLNAFFFGLIAASAVVLFREVDLDARCTAVALAAALVAVLITGVTGGTTSTSLVVLFLAATLAASAMVLPGVSGAFLLLVLGQYERFLALVTDFTGALSTAAGGDVGALVDPLIGIAVFGAGAVTGILSISHAVGWALEHYRGPTLAALVGLLVGGLRLPAEEVAATDPLAAGSTVPVVAAGVLGAGALLAFDHFTDDLDY